MSVATIKFHSGLRVDCSIFLSDFKQILSSSLGFHKSFLYRVILSVLDPRKCEYLKDYSLDFEHAYMTTYLAS